MKSRKVVITIKVETDTPIDILRNKGDITLFYITSDGDIYYPEIIRVEAKVIKK